MTAVFLLLGTFLLGSLLWLNLRYHRSLKQEVARRAQLSPEQRAQAQLEEWRDQQW